MYISCNTMNRDNFCWNSLKKLRDPNEPDVKKCSADQHCPILLMPCLVNRPGSCNTLSGGGQVNA